MKRFKWPLAVSPYTVRDRLKIVWRILTDDHYTMGKSVAEFERRMSQLSGMHALAVSSGSAANHLLFELWKIKNPGETAVVICPAVTWISAVSPAIMAGFEVRFCDINLTDLSFDYAKLEKAVQFERVSGKRVIIWPTALVGYVPAVESLRAIAAINGAELFMDCCENTLSRVNGRSILSSCDITTTSCYFAHQIQAIEFGFVFFKDEGDYELGKMFRNHGMSRSLPEKSKRRWDIEAANPDVDPLFLFALAGTNFRPSDLNAMFGLCDLDRADSAEAHRQKIYRYFVSKIPHTCYRRKHIQEGQSMFCLPIFFSVSGLPTIKERLKAAGIEFRPIVGANLLRQPCLKKYGNASDFPNAEIVHNYGFYVGLHQDVTEKMVDELIRILSERVTSWRK